MGEMKRAVAREQATRYEEEQRMRDRFSSTLVIAASIIAGIRLARDENISRPSPRLTTVIADSIALAKAILDKVVRLEKWTDVLRTALVEKLEAVMKFASEEALFMEYLF